MSHLSLRDLNRIVEIATRQYQSGTKSPQAFDYLTACRAAIVKPELLPKQDESSEHTVSASDFSNVDYNNMNATGAYDLAKSKADESDNKDAAFAKKLKNELRKRFVIQDPVFSVINEIDQHIQQFRSPANWFRRSAQDKIDALEALKQRLLTITNGTISTQIDAWLEENGATITSSRNIFKRKAEENTSTIQFIEDLKAVYGQESLSLEGYEMPREEKQKIYQPLLNYIQLRTSWFQQIITFIFRNKDVSTKKLAFAHDVMVEVQDSDSYESLRLMLVERRTEHTKRSKEIGKPHYNLDSRREPAVSQHEEISSGYQEIGNEIPPQRKTTVSFWRRPVEEGEIRLESGLAEAFHESIEAASSMRI
ncbi:MULTISPECIES: hypothetical protein [Legionella]|uniref:Uncharacterized protein n=1 Tax=Legionella drozanskii LLAP-1 TaxID=1212489 RepID=A0A0W0SXA6_9GAMM|nr:MULTISPECIES: hypothetical protein [Legionella]KTC87945.1 hypothetical protein Ldro_1564 [Legionella drozanskii LLAP-1]PJE08816.1 MAG: hypothetical protein CK430_12035 [Legionella sp.]